MQIRLVGSAPCSCMGHWARTSHTQVGLQPEKSALLPTDSQPRTFAPRPLQA